MSQRIVTVTRWPSTDEGTFGTLVTDSGYTCVSGELPDRGDQADVSCIPKGVYTAIWLWSEHHKCYLYHIAGVPDGRTQIEIHAANFMGDVSKGLVSQLHGCLAPGVIVSMFKAGTQYARTEPPLPKDQRGVSASGNTLVELHNDLKDGKGAQMPFALIIK